MSRVLACFLATAALAGLVGQPASAAGPSSSLEIAKAWVPAAAKTGSDVPLYMTIANRAGAADELLRLRCPVSHFSEKRTTDYGEGAPHAREVKTIPIPPNETVVLKPGGYHLVLLKTKEPLEQGKAFSCTLAFRNAGSLPVEVMVTAEEAKSAH